MCRTSLQRYSENCRIENYMQSISRCETLVNYSGLYEEEKGIEKRAYNKGGCAFYVSTQEKLEVFLLFF